MFWRAAAAVTAPAGANFSGFGGVGFGLRAMRTLGRPEVSPLADFGQLWGGGYGFSVEAEIGVYFSTGGGFSAGQFWAAGSYFCGGRSCVLEGIVLGGSLSGLL